MKDGLEPLRRVLRFIEDHLGESISLDDLAVHACLSPWHFHRFFTAVVGEPPVGYLRRRRLSVAAQRLKNGTPKVLNVALSVGFESQAAFTRAFCGQFGVPPGRFQRTGKLPVPHTYEPVDVQALRVRGENKMKPEIIEMPAFVVVDMTAEFGPDSLSRVPQLWSEFGPKVASIPGRKGRCTFGMQLAAAKSRKDEPRCTYLACVEVDKNAKAPRGMTRREVRAARYAVFTHDGHISRMSQFVDRVFGEWLPAAGLTRVDAPDFRLTDQRWDPRTGTGPVDYYVPIALL